MKKVYLILAAITLLAISMSFVLAPAAKTHSKSVNTTTAIPDDVKQIFQKSCMGCHADGGNHMAMSKVNFSKWDNYDAKKQAAKGAAICKVVTKGKMPPNSVRKSKPELVPTKEQIDLICKWSQTLGK